MICKQDLQDFNVGDEVIMQNDEVVYTVVFMNKGARNATLRNPQKNSYKFGVPFIDIRLAPQLTPLCEVKLCEFGRGDRVLLGSFDIYNVVDIEFVIPEGYMCKLESLGGDIGGWYPESDLTLYATGATLESLKEINAATPRILSGIPSFVPSFMLGEVREVPDSALAEATAVAPKWIDMNEALSILMEATRIQMEYITRNPDPQCTPELIEANRLLARIHRVMKK